MRFISTLSLQNFISNHLLHDSFQGDNNGTIDKKKPESKQHMEVIFSDGEKCLKGVVYRNLCTRFEKRSSRRRNLHNHKSEPQSLQECGIQSLNDGISTGIHI